MLNYWTSPVSKSLKYLRSPISTKNKISLTKSLRYFYYTKQNQYMELEYSFKGNVNLDEKEKQIF